VKVLIVGAGVIGTVYGAQLAAAGAVVSVLSHGHAPMTWLPRACPRVTSRAEPGSARALPWSRVPAAHSTSSWSRSAVSS